MNPFQLLFALFILVPVLEIYLLIKVGGVIGALPTALLVVMTAVIGAGLLRMQGFSTMLRAREAMARGELPAIEMLEGVAMLIGGALLLTPGFFTDALGFLCLIPPVRRWLILRFLQRANVIIAHRGAPSGHGPRTIEGEFTRRDR